MGARRLALALAALTLLVYLRPLFLGDTFLLRDHVSYVLPSRAHLGAALRRGELPEWWDGVGLGAPFAANPNHGVFYPPTWLVAVLPTGLAADLLIILHVLGAGLGAAALARRLGAGLIAAGFAGAAALLSGYLTSMVPQALAALTFAWLPWVAWAADRVAAAQEPRARLRAAALLSAMWAAQILSGDPAGVLDAGLLVLAVVLARRPAALPAVAAAGVLAVALAGALVLPALGLLAESERAAGLALASAGEWSLAPRRLLELVWPAPFGDPTAPGPVTTWAMSIHLGAPIVLLAAVAAWRKAPAARVLALAAAALLLLALGTHTPLYALWYALPGASWLRYPEKHVAGAVILLSVMAALGWDLAWRTRAGTALGKRARLLPLLAAAVALAPSLHHALGLQVVGPRASFQHVPAVLAGAAAGRVYRPERSLVRAEGSVPDLVVAAYQSAIPNVAAPFGFADVPGYDPASPRRLDALVEEAEARGRAPRLLAALDVAHVVLPARVAAAAGLAPVGSTPDGSTVRIANEVRRPRAFVAPRWRRVESDAHATLALLDSEADPYLVQIAAATTSEVEGAPAPPSGCAVERHRAEETIVRCDSPAGGQAVLLDGWSAGWRATLDGQPVPIERADVVARAVRVLPGAHAIRFRYRTPGLRAGWLLSAAAWVVLLAGVVLLRRRDGVGHD